MIADSSISLNHRRLQNYSSDETIKNQNHIYSNDATETSKVQSLMLHVESHVDGQDVPGQACEDADKSIAECSQNNIFMSSPYKQSNTTFEKRSIHTGVDSLDEVGDLPMDVSLACSQYASTMVWSFQLYLTLIILGSFGK